MAQSSTKEKPATLEELCAKTKHGEPALFELGGKRFAIVTDEDLELFQTLEDRMDIALAKQAMQEEGLISHEEIKKTFTISD